MSEIIKALLNNETILACVLIFIFLLGALYAIGLVASIEEECENNKIEREKK